MNLSKLSLLPFSAPGVSPVIAYEKAGVKVVVHFASERPRPDIVTMVVSSLSTCPTPVTGFSFQAAVPKVGLKSFVSIETVLYLNDTSPAMLN